MRAALLGSASLAQLLPAIELLLLFAIVLLPLSMLVFHRTLERLRRPERFLTVDVHLSKYTRGKAARQHKKTGDCIRRLFVFFDSDQDFFFLVVTLVAIPGAI